MLIEIGMDLFDFFIGYGAATILAIRNLYIITTLIVIVFDILTYGLIMFFCRKNFFEQCKNPENIAEG